MADQEQSAAAQNTRVRADVDQLQKDFAKLRGDVGDLVSSLKDVSKDGAAIAKARLDAGLQGIKKGVVVVREKGEVALDGTREKIQERPITSVLIALGVGILVGKLLERRRD